MYFPQSQYIGNLYTNGDKYVIATSGTPYTGYYFKTYSNELYTGKTPEDGPTQLLVEIQQPMLDDITPPAQPFYIYQSPTSTYNNKPPTVRYIPLPNMTLPTPDDYKQGVFTRFFCKKTNELKYIEIDQKTFNDLQSKSAVVAWDLYTPQSIHWYITGEMDKIYNLNKSIVYMVEVEEKWHGFSQYFKQNFAKYFAI